MWARLSGVLAGGFVFLLILNPPLLQMGATTRLRFEPLVRRAAGWGILGSREVSIGPDGISTIASSGVPILAGENWLTDHLGIMPMLLPAALLASWTASRQMGLGKLATALLLAWSALLIVLGLPLASGFLLGWGLSLELHEQYTVITGGVAKGIAGALVCAAIAATWALIDWVWPESGGTPLAEAPRRPWQAWSALGASAIPAVLYFLGALSVALQVRHGFHAQGFIWEAARYGALGGVLMAACVMLMVALIRGKPSCRAWIVLLPVVPLGGGPAAGAALLLAALCARLPDQEGHFIEKKGAGGV
jgi:hypothetical protein